MDCFYGLFSDNQDDNVTLIAAFRTKEAAEEYRLNKAGEYEADLIDWYWPIKMIHFED